MIMGATILRGGMSPVNVIIVDMSDIIPRGLHESARDQAGVVTRGQALQAGMTVGAINARVKFGRWRRVYRGVYVTFTGPLDRDAELWAAVLFGGAGARLSHETAAEILRLNDRRSPLIHVTIPADRRVIPAPGIAIHLSSGLVAGWRFARGVPPHTFAEETVIDLVGAAADLDDAITAGAGGTHSVLEYRYDRDVARAHGLPAASKQVPFARPGGGRGYRSAACRATRGPALAARPAAGPPVPATCR